MSKTLHPAILEDEGANIARRSGYVFKNAFLRRRTIPNIIFVIGNTFMRFRFLTLKINRYLAKRQL